MPDPDQLSKSKTIYDVGWNELFWRNFVAGMARTIGSLLLYAVVLFFLTSIFLQRVWPILEPVLESFETSTQFLRGFDPNQPTLTR